MMRNDRAALHFTRTMVNLLRGTPLKTPLQCERKATMAQRVILVVDGDGDDFKGTVEECRSNFIEAGFTVTNIVIEDVTEEQQAVDFQTPGAEASSG